MISYLSDNIFDPTQSKIHDSLTGPQIERFSHLEKELYAVASAVRDILGNGSTERDDLEKALADVYYIANLIANKGEISLVRMMIYSQVEKPENYFQYVENK